MLRFEGITQVFGGLTALDDISFTVKKGEITGVIGPNGAGKTTLFNIVSGIYNQTAGSVFLGDRNVSGFPPEKLATMGMVRTFQNIARSTSGIFSCAFKLPGHLKEERAIRERAMHWLDFTGITDLSQADASSLPFGKGRLLEIARAMALEPRIILMDEPAAGLNSRETVELAALIRKIRETGVTVVLVEHDMELVMDVCDSILVLNLGRKLAEGTPRAIQENPAVIAAYLGEG